MSYRVTDPRTNTSTVFPSESVARTYAKSVKGAVVEPCDTACAAVVTTCPEGTVDAQRASSKDFYKADGAWTPSRLRDDNVDESAAERYVETVTQARLMGASVSDALDEGRDAS
jgi:hypothetical protein